MTNKLCKVGYLVDALPAKHKKAVVKSMDNRKETSSYAITKALWESGFDIGERTIDRHRSTNCICYKQLGENK